MLALLSTLALQTIYGDQLQVKIRAKVDHALALLASGTPINIDAVSRFLVSPDNMRVFESTDRLLESLVLDQHEAAKATAQRAAGFSSQMTCWTFMILMVALVLRPAFQAISERFAGTEQDIAQ